MKKKEQSKITLADIGETLYTTTGKDVWRLIDFKPTPQVKMLNLHDGDEKEGNLSEFKNFDRLLPQREMKRVRKIRSDAGTHRPARIMSKDGSNSIALEANKPQSTAQTGEFDSAGIPQPLNLIIKTIPGIDGGYKVSIGEFSYASTFLRDAIIGLLSNFGGKIPAELNADDRKQLDIILNP